MRTKTFSFMMPVLACVVFLMYQNPASATPSAVTLVCPSGAVGAHVLSGFIATKMYGRQDIVYNHPGTMHDNCGECERARTLLIDNNLEAYSAAATLGALPNRGQLATSADISAVREAHDGGLWIEKAGGTSIVNADRIVGLACLPAARQ